MSLVDVVRIGLTLTGVVVFLFFALLVYVIVCYRQVIYTIFETKPLFLTPSRPPALDAENVSFKTSTGRQLSGSYLKTTNGPRRGVILFCHEFSANRWLCHEYVTFLREHGYDLFAFDFCNSGASEAIANYVPLQWVTEYEIEDVLAAVKYLRARPDAVRDGIGVLGVSKGGGAALVAASREPFLKAVVTDGAFPTHETVIQYIKRWVAIYVQHFHLHWYMPRIFWKLLTEYIVWRTEIRRKVRYPHVERAAKRFAGRAFLMIHGEKDSYITQPIAKHMFDCVNTKAKEFWLVAGAKHNACVAKAGNAYREKVLQFFNATFADTAPAPTAISAVTGVLPNPTGPVPTTPSISLASAAPT